MPHHLPPSVLNEHFSTGSSNPPWIFWIHEQLGVGSLNSPWRGVRTPSKCLLMLKLTNKKTGPFSFSLAHRPWLIWDKFIEHVSYARPEAEHGIAICCLLSARGGHRHRSWRSHIPGGWERSDAWGARERDPGEGDLGTVITYKLEFWQHLTVLLATTGKAHLGRRSRILCQIRSACARLPDWTLRAKDLIAMVSEPINRLGELVRRKCRVRG